MGTIQGKMVAEDFQDCHATSPTSKSRPGRMKSILNRTLFGSISRANSSSSSNNNNNNNNNNISGDFLPPRQDEEVVPSGWSSKGSRTLPGTSSLLARQNLFRVSCSNPGEVRREEKVVVKEVSTDRKSSSDACKRTKFDEDLFSGKTTRIYFTSRPSLERALAEQFQASSSNQVQEPIKPGRRFFFLPFQKIFKRQNSTSSSSFSSLSSDQKYSLSAVNMTESEQLEPTKEESTWVSYKDQTIPNLSEDTQRPLRRNKVLVTNFDFALGKAYRRLSRSTNSGKEEGSTFPTISEDWAAESEGSDSSLLELRKRANRRISSSASLSSLKRQLKSSIVCPAPFPDGTSSNSHPYSKRDRTRTRSTPPRPSNSGNLGDFQKLLCQKVSLGSSKNGIRTDPTIPGFDTHSDSSLVTRTDEIAPFSFPVRSNGLPNLALDMTDFKQPSSSSCKEILRGETSSFHDGSTNRAEGGRDPETSDADSKTETTSSSSYSSSPFKIKALTGWCSTTDSAPVSLTPSSPSSSVTAISSMNASTSRIPRPSIRDNVQMSARKGGSDAGSDIKTKSENGSRLDLEMSKWKGSKIPVRKTSPGSDSGTSDLDPVVDTFGKQITNRVGEGDGRRASPPVRLVGSVGGRGGVGRRVSLTASTKARADGRCQGTVATRLLGSVPSLDVKTKKAERVLMGDQGREDPDAKAGKDEDVKRSKGLNSSLPVPPGMGSVSEEKFKEDELEEGEEKKGMDQSEEGCKTPNQRNRVDLAFESDSPALAPEQDSFLEKGSSSSPFHLMEEEGAMFEMVKGRMFCPNVDLQVVDDSAVEKAGYPLRQRTDSPSETLLHCSRDEEREENGSTHGDSFKSRPCLDDIPGSFVTLSASSHAGQKGLTERGGGKESGELEVEEEMERWSIGTLSSLRNLEGSVKLISDCQGFCLHQYECEILRSELESLKTRTQVKESETKVDRGNCRRLLKRCLVILEQPSSSISSNPGVRSSLTLPLESGFGHPGSTARDSDLSPWSSASPSTSETSLENELKGGLSPAVELPDSFLVDENFGYTRGRGVGEGFSEARALEYRPQTLEGRIHGKDCPFWNQSSPLSWEAQDERSRIRKFSNSEGDDGRRLLIQEMRAFLDGRGAPTIGATVEATARVVNEAKKIAGRQILWEAGRTDSISNEAKAKEGGKGSKPLVGCKRSLSDGDLELEKGEHSECPGSPVDLEPKGVEERHG
ncbi:hypothetical protein IE53DRAFT_57923 [Violaceomyces palustris]|uniref:Uncharacterized protein n=1 Tax=Violaceomyces palustris TaxID=1673888 RepID=A0ACD0NZL0_9BASI|nr:hypothetical protein IE53DRAFT_57923 [Violaceomyces palustris]